MPGSPNWRGALAAGHSAVVDAVYARPEEREAIEAVAKAAGAPFEGVWLELSLEERIRRVGGRVLDASDADAKVARMQEQYDPGEIRWRRVEADGLPEEVVKRTLAALRLS